MTALSPTDEQSAIIEALRSTPANIMVGAMAGCAKSSTIEMATKRIAPVPCTILVFNKKNKLELESRVPGWVQVKTLNGLGHAAWSKAIGVRCTPDDRKLGKLITQLAREDGLELSQDQWSAVRQLVVAAMTAGLVPGGLPYSGLVEDTEEGWLGIAADQWIEGIDAQLIAFTRAVLRESIKLAFQGAISFDDQIYCSAMLGGVFSPVPLLIIDEAQDLSPLNCIQVRKQAKGRIMAVGDQLQAIYGWRGASHTSMEDIRALRPSWTDLKLTLTFRCPKAHVARASAHAIGFRAAPQNAEGRIVHLGSLGTAEHWSWPDVAREAHANQIVVLCRNNAPLVSLAFKLIRRQVGVHMLGRDIGKGLKVLSEKICPQDDTSAVDCLNLIQAWADHQIALARANDNMAKAEKIADQTECLLAVIESYSVANAKELRLAIVALFAKETGLVTLSSIHKFKGMENQTIIHLDPFRIPSRWAQEQARKGDDRQLLQEMNLRYVAETRSKDVLILANLEDFE